MTAFEEEMEEKDLKPEDIVQSLPRRKVRRMSVTRVAEETDLRLQGVEQVVLQLQQQFMGMK